MKIARLTGGFAVLSLLGACAGSPAAGYTPDSTDPNYNPATARRLQGRIQNDEGARGEGFGGDGSATAATTVEAITVRDGARDPSSAQARSRVGAGGTFELVLPETTADGVVIVQALDAGGRVVARAIVERTPEPGRTESVQPLTTESSVEAAVLLDLASRDVRPSEVDVVYLRARVDGRTAAVVREAAAADADSARGQVGALASAFLAANTATRIGLDDFGVDAAAYRSAELDLVASINTKLHSNTMSAAQATTELTGGLAGVRRRFSLDAEGWARIETQASTSSRLAVNSSLQSEVLVRSFDRANAVSEARAVADGLVVALGEANVPDDVMVRAAIINSTLVTSVEAASTTEGIDEAFEQWRVAIRGDGATGGSLLGAMAQGRLVELFTLDAVVNATVASGNALELALDLALRLSQSGGTQVDVALLAERVHETFARFTAELTATTRASLQTTSATDVELVISVLALTEASYR